MGALIFLVVVGVGLIACGIAFFRGHLRGGLVYQTIFSSGMYSLIPLGLACINISLMAIFPYPHFIGIVLIYTTGVFLLVVIVFSIVMPKMLDPWWLRLLKEKYPNTSLSYFYQEAAKDYIQWVDRTQTIEEMEKWAEEVINKR